MQGGMILVLIITQLLFPFSFFLSKEPFIRHSRQNLALEMETQASSTDNYDGCKHSHCLKRLALSRFAVDGNSTTCFLSLKEYHPWFLVKLDRYHPIALIHVVLGAVDSERKKRVFVGN